MLLVSITTGCSRACVARSVMPTAMSLVCARPPEVSTAPVLKPLNDSVPGTKKLMLVKRLSEGFLPATASRSKFSGMRKKPNDSPVRTAAIASSNES